MNIQSHILVFFCRLRIFPKIMSVDISGFVFCQIHSVVTKHFSYSLLYLWLRSHFRKHQGSKCVLRKLITCHFIAPRGHSCVVCELCLICLVKVNKISLLRAFGDLWGYVVLQSGLRSCLPRGTAVASCEEALHISSRNAIRPFGRTWSSRVAHNIYSLLLQLESRWTAIGWTIEYLVKPHQLLLDFLQWWGLMYTEETGHTD
jgi:hypothetical protein